MTDSLVKVGRVLFRIEGAMWAAYWAPRQDSIADAVLIGSIRLVAVTDRPARKAAFIDLIKAAVGDGIRDITGSSPAWGEPHPAPENE